MQQSSFQNRLHLVKVDAWDEQPINHSLILMQPSFDLVLTQTAGVHQMPQVSRLICADERLHRGREVLLFYAIARAAIRAPRRKSSARGRVPLNQDQLGGESGQVLDEMLDNHIFHVTFLEAHHQPDRVRQVLNLLTVQFSTKVALPMMGIVEEICQQNLQPRHLHRHRQQSFRNLDARAVVSD